MTLALNSLSDSPVTGLCLVGPGAERKPSAFLVLQNNSAQTLTANVFVAEYDADDTLLNCGVRQVVVQSTQKSSVILHAEDPDTARINVFVLDQTFRALTFKLPASI